MKKLLFFLAFMAPSAAFSQTPPDPKVSVPVSLLQKLVDAGQEAPGKIINPLTDQVRTLIKDQLEPKMAQAGPTTSPTPPGPSGTTPPAPTTPPGPPAPENPPPPHHPPMPSPGPEKK